MTEGKELILKAISISLHGDELISLDATIAPGEVLTVMGPSGSGKSTLLAYIGGFLDPVFQASGEVMVNGIDLIGLLAENRHAGILFQDPLLFPHLSVTDNIAIAIPQDISSPRERRALAEEALAEVGLEGFGNRDPDTLSGGQKARVALKRVLMSQPRILLLDEPFSKLDTGLRDQTREMVFDRAREAGLPIILVTHDAADARAAGGQVFTVGKD